MSSALVRPAFDEFRALAATHNRVSVVATLICDELTPVSAFVRLNAGAERAFLFESVVGGEKVARYSFLSANPAKTFEATRDQVRLTDHRAGQVEVSTHADPLGVLEGLLAEYNAAALPGLPRFLGGAVGYAAYDMVRYVEKLPDAPPDDRDLPDLLFDIYESMVVFDLAHKTVLVVAYATVSPGADEAELRAAYDAARGAIDAVVHKLSQPAAMAPVQVDLPAPPAD